MPNLKYEEAADRYGLPRFTYGDIVMCEQHDKPLVVVRVGWNGDPSPYYGDHVWKAWCESTHWDQGDHFADWIELTALTVVGRAEAEVTTLPDLAWESRHMADIHPTECSFETYPHGKEKQMLQPPGHPCRHCQGTGRHETLGDCPECYGTGRMHMKDVDRRLSDIERRLAEYDALAGYRAFVHSCIKSGEMPATFEEYVTKMKASEILNLENRQSVEFEARGASFKVHRNDTSLVGPDMEEKYILSVHVRGERQFINALSRTQVEKWVAQLIEQGVLES